MLAIGTWLSEVHNLNADKFHHIDMLWLAKTSWDKIDNARVLAMTLQVHSHPILCGCDSDGRIDNIYDKFPPMVLAKYLVELEDEVVVYDKFSPTVLVKYWVKLEDDVVVYDKFPPTVLAKYQGELKDDVVGWQHFSFRSLNIELS